MFACSNEQRKSILSGGMRTWLGESQDPPPPRVLKTLRRL